jgi:hypothetical protein
LSSDDSVTSFNEDVAEELKKKHPSPSRELFFPDATTIFNTVKQKKQFFRFRNPVTFAASLPKNQPQLPFSTLLSKKTVSSSWKKAFTVTSRSKTIIVF